MVVGQPSRLPILQRRQAGRLPYKFHGMVTDACGMVKIRVSRRPSFPRPLGAAGLQPPPKDLVVVGRVPPRGVRGPCSVAHPCASLQNRYPALAWVVENPATTIRIIDVPRIR